MAAARQPDESGRKFRILRKERSTCRQIVDKEFCPPKGAIHARTPRDPDLSQAESEGWDDVG
jgi:hypothetical protein